jgi:hypothetical protein
MQTQTGKGDMPRNAGPVESSDRGLTEEASLRWSAGGPRIGLVGCERCYRDPFGGSIPSRPLRSQRLVASSRRSAANRSAQLYDVNAASDNGVRSFSAARSD